MTGDEVFDLYEIQLSANTMYLINVTPEYGLDVGVYLFNDTGSRYDAKADSDIFSGHTRESIAFKPSKTGYYAVLVTNENMMTEGQKLYNISVSTVAENCGSSYCSGSGKINLGTMQICNLVTDDAWYNITTGYTNVAVFLDVPRTGDYDLWIDSPCGNPYCDSLSIGNGTDESCTINGGGTYWLNVYNYSGSGTFQLYVGNDADGNGVPDFMGRCSSQADDNNDGVVSDFELLAYINDWADGTVNDFELLSAIDEWANGCLYLKGRPASSKIASGYRTIKTASVQAGSSYTTDITIDINESNKPNSIVIIEEIPIGWNLTGSSLTVDSFNISTGVIKWNLRGSNVSDMVINYTVLIPADEMDNGTVSGDTKYIDEGSNILIDTIGNTTVITNRVCAMGINPPSFGDWGITQNTTCENADISLSSGSDLKVYNTTLILENTEVNTHRINFMIGNSRIVFSGNTTIRLS